MRIHNDQFQLSASDVVKHLACRHLTLLDLRAARGELEPPHWRDPGVAILEERGSRHEADYLSYLKTSGYEVLEEQGPEENTGFQRTLNAMKSGVQVIAQAYLEEGHWRGRADVLLRIEGSSKLGKWSYEVVDTKLARETKGGTILQLCLYSELVEKIQGYMPESMHVVAPGRNFEKETFRLKDYLAYYRFVKKRLEREVRIAGGTPAVQTYPEPVEHCEICRWWPMCNDRRRKDDHLSFVAGISKLQIVELRKWRVTTLAELATLPLPLKSRPERGSAAAYEKVREQARLQLQYRETEKPVHELLNLEPERGLARLPEPSAGDIFLDFEADPFVEDGGIEYLLGYVTLNEAGDANYTSTWALNRNDERRMFESFIDMVMERLTHFPDLHIYHFSHYEPAALKRLMGRYATREDEMDRLLRAGVLIDLHGILKQALRASVERYSLKDLEVFFGFQRKTDLRDAKQSLRILESALELNDVENLPSEIRQIVEAYNREDCISTWRLRDWLEDIRKQLVASGNQIERPAIQTGDASEEVDERRKRVLELMARLLRDIPDDESERTPEQQATWLIAHMLEWHRRENKVSWWEYFRLKELSDDELLHERDAIAGLEFVKRIGGTARCPIDRYRFPQQDTDIREGDSLETSAASFGTVEALDTAKRTIDIKKKGTMAETHPASVFTHKLISDEVLVDSLLRLGNWIADNGVDVEGRYRAARDLLLRKKPRILTELRGENGYSILEEAQRLGLQLDHCVLPIQGPPGAGKTFTGARMIWELLRNKKKIGITAMSHKVIRKLLEEVLKAAGSENVSCMQKVPDDFEGENPAIIEPGDNSQVIAALKSGEVKLVGGTAWLWSRPEFAESVDVLFIDEAGQMSLPDVLAVSQAAKSIVLLGDPQQLEQPIQGTHPPGVAVSALQHILGDNQTMPADSGLFLPETWRLAPAICQFTSELFYDNRLASRDGLEHQQITGSSLFSGSGLWFFPVIHEGNQNSCEEEADAVAQIVQDLLSSGSWIDQTGESKKLRLDDILIVAPYNAQVFKIAERIPKGRIGTVDKFQGQEAPVVIYSMATSSPEDAPRGMEFLYSLNRFNVATSRARCACILVASPRLFEPDCKTPHQMKLANALCRYLELAKVVYCVVLKKVDTSLTSNCITFGRCFVVQTQV